MSRNGKNNYILNNIKKSKTISQKYPKEDYNNNNRRNKIPLYKIFMEENNTKAKQKFHLMKNPSQKYSNFLTKIGFGIRRLFLLFYYLNHLFYTYRFFFQNGV